jgi:hypothetical protein
VDELHVDFYHSNKAKHKRMCGIKERCVIDGCVTTAVPSTMRGCGIELHCGGY